MPRKAVPQQQVSVAISVEVQQLLAQMAEAARTNPSAILEFAVREKARRDKGKLTAQGVGNGAEAAPAPKNAVSGSAPVDLRPLAARAAAGDAAAEAEIKRVIARMRSTATITPAKRSEELDPDWSDRFVALVERMRRAVPEEWTEEELEEQIAQEIAEVHANRAGDH